MVQVFFFLTASFEYRGESTHCKPSTHHFSRGAEAADVSIHGADEHVAGRGVWGGEDRDADAVRPQNLAAVLRKEGGTKERWSVRGLAEFAARCLSVFSV